MFNKHAQLREKFLITNHAPYIKKKPRVKLLCIGLNLKQNISKLKLKPISNYSKNIKTSVVSYTRRKEENIRTKNVSDSKEFSKTMRPFLSNKNTMYSQFSLEKDNGIVSDNFDLSKEFSTCFEDAVRLLNVKPDEYYLSDTKNSSDSVDIDIRKFKNHPSVQAIKKNISVNHNFYFSNTIDNDLLKEVTDLNHK